MNILNLYFNLNHEIYNMNNDMTCFRLYKVQTMLWTGLSNLVALNWYVFRNKELITLNYKQAYTIIIQCNWTYIDSEVSEIVNCN